VPDNPSGALAGINGIGALRWPVTLYERQQAPGPDGAISEHLMPLARVHADIQPTYPGTFYLSAQIETPVSHLIRMRWHDYLPLTNVIIRATKRPGDDTLRGEIFRVRRLKELAGRKRFAEVEAELERVVTMADEDDLNGFLEHRASVAPTTRVH
jgi:hypothetical protein